jgi:N-acetylglutamate synthase-like GNAT family acetyltransferase
MKIEKINGLDELVYKHIAPYAMCAEFIKRNGNPITTSDKHSWYVGFDGDGRVACFCSVKRSDFVKCFQTGNLFIISGGKKSFDALVKRVIKDIAGKGLALNAYANNDNKPWFEKLGFEISKVGVNWHNMNYNDERLRSNKKKT